VVNHPDGLAYSPDGGRIQDLGFADACSFSITDRPPRSQPLPFDGWCADKFFALSGSYSGLLLGRAEVQEAYVYDDQHRAEIDFTGLRLKLTLRPDALARYDKFIGECLMPERASDQTAWHGRLALRIPARPFKFPTPRGSSPPFPPAGASVRNLRPIRTFEFDSMDVVKLAGPEVFAEDLAVTADELRESLHLQSG
jgi:hypothetical protein